MKLFIRLVVSILVTLCPSICHASWANISCPWDPHQAVRNIVNDSNDNLYIGIAGGDAGQGDLWKRSPDGTCTQIGGDGINGTWSNVNSVSGLLIDGDYLYASTGYYSPQVWRMSISSGQWSQIAGPGIAGTWDATNYEWAYEIVKFQGKIYVGLRNSDFSKGGALWRFDDPTWTKIYDFPYPESGGVYSVLNVNDQWLYLGLDGQNGHGGELYRYDGTNTPVRVAGDGLNGSWTMDNTSQRLVESLGWFQGKVIVGLGFLPRPGIWPIWECDVDTLQCSHFGATAPQVWTLPQYFHIWNHFLTLTTPSPCPCGPPCPSSTETLYVGAGAIADGDESHGRASIWKYTGSDANGSWLTEVAGDGIDGSWPYPLPGVPVNSGGEWVYRLLQYQNGFVAGTAGGTGAALWQWRPPE